MQAINRVTRKQTGAWTLRFCAMVLACCASFLGTAAAQADTLEDIKQEGVLKVAVPQDFPPFGSIGTDMKPQGYDIDMATLIANDLGVDVELIPVTSANRIPFLTTGKADLVISSLGKNPDRAKVIDFSEPYAPFFNGVFGPKASTVEGAEDLDGKMIAVTRGSIEDLELTKIAPDSATLKRFEDNNATISAFLSGQTDLIATGNVVAAAVAERTSSRDLEVKFLIKNSPCYVGVAKGDTALIAKVNDIIKAAREDGRLNDISQRWLNAPLPEQL
ncbi:transporter substrate-binding domain-containing protein [Marinobacter nanhaiticus D15-8W]|uniref:Amino acid ABC transporter substrate-binding protein n=1 Tax=Marinobacter nanhaiticus D15-8W TaxID=626887 RepID=N6VS42_9GAMM|nr:transporter substrate-binding domain-containing protein [Marinobacter nanhaiticus]ENO13005.1 amino acid ABC transporter substrate-binding protein [Marinobacter nanhaiticus D15-8W]BES70359.1 transporter substrate-binding domain-containing protein [Marinobacter nanhaiticus D15-8W]